jgi:hypothetical protein
MVFRGTHSIFLICEAVEGGKNHLDHLKMGLGITIPQIKSYN